MRAWDSEMKSLRLALSGIADEVTCPRPEGWTPEMTEAITLLFWKNGVEPDKALETIRDLMMHGFVQPIESIFVDI